MDAAEPNRPRTITACASIRHRPLHGAATLQYRPCTVMAERAREGELPMPSSSKSASGSRSAVAAS